MVKIIMHGCCGHMGQVISDLVEKDTNAEIVAGIDVTDKGNTSYPVFTDIHECKTEADVLIDFSSAKAADALLDYCVERSLPVVLCTTGLSDEQLAKVEDTAKKIPVLKSANMSLGINTLMKLIQDAAKVLATAGFDMEIVEKHHRLKLDAPSGTALALADSLNEAMDNQYHYDFGDDWMFTITVSKIVEVQKDFSPRIVKAKGSIQQYPDWDEDEFDYE